MTGPLPASDTEERSVVTLTGPGGERYRVCIAMRGASFYEPLGIGSPLAPLLDKAIARAVRMIGRRTPRRKVGVLSYQPTWGFYRCRYKVWVGSKDEADALASKLCDELAQGHQRWRD